MEARREEAIADPHRLPIERYLHGILVARIWQRCENFSAYAATYRR